jgi:replicative DNA helicase
MINENFSLSSEQSIIGTLITEPFKLDELQVTENDFYDGVNKIIFGALVQMSEKNSPIDIITLAEFLEKRKQLSHVGGLAYLGRLAQNAISTSNIKRHAEIVKDKALVRELISIASSIQEKCISSSDSASDLVASAEAEIFSIMDKRETSEPVPVHKAVEEAVEHLGNVIDGLTYQSTGLTDLDALIGGLRGGATYVIAARSSMGKTALMCSIAHHVAQTLPCYIATLEMPRREIASRLMAIDGNVDLGNAKNWTEEDYARITKAAGTIKDLPITIDHEEGLSLAKLRSRCRRAKRRKGLGCIFVDYLQLMKSKADTREREVAQISEGLKSLAKELDVPVIVLAQLNRDCDKRTDKRPLMSDLRESGSIEQDADVIVMLYRDVVYNKDTQYKDIAELLVRKNRHGATGDIYTKFTASTMRFSDKSYDWMMPSEFTESKTYSRGFSN